MTRNLAGVLMLLVASTSAFAQVRPSAPQLGTAPYQGPIVSPYLNMFRAGASPAVNYYGLVRPQFEFSGSIQQLQQRTLSTQQELGAAEQNLPTTGHAVGFMTQARYFNTLGRPGMTVGTLGGDITFSPRSRVPSGGIQTGVPVPR